MGLLRTQAGGVIGCPPFPKPLPLPYTAPLPAAWNCPCPPPGPGKAVLGGGRGARSYPPGLTLFLVPPDQYMVVGAEEGIYTLNLHELHEDMMEKVRGGSGQDGGLGMPVA